MRVGLTLVLTLLTGASTIALPGGDTNPRRSFASRVGKATVQSYCLPCHSLSAITEVRLSPEEWSEIIDEMIEIGAEIPPDRRRIIHAYLVEHHGIAPEKTGESLSELVRASMRTGQERNARDTHPPERGLEARAERGRQTYEDFGCDNCHTLDGVGAKGLTGPELGNVGSTLSRKMIENKLRNPRAFFAEGFREEYDENTMPLYEFIGEELEALVTYLSSLKNDRLSTPRGIVPEAQATADP